MFVDSFWRILRVVGNWGSGEVRGTFKRGRVTWPAPLTTFKHFDIGQYIHHLSNWRIHRIQKRSGNQAFSISGTVSHLVRQKENWGLLAPGANGGQDLAQVGKA